MGNELTKMGAKITRRGIEFAQNSLMFLLATVAFLCAASSVVKAENISQMVGKDCVRPSSIPSEEIYQNLRGINLYVDVPAQLREAIQCHGDEEKCAEKLGSGVTATIKKEYARKLIDNYNALPLPLHTENITKVFFEQIRKKLSPFILPNALCEVPDPDILDQENLFQKTKETGVVTITVRLFLMERTKPRIAILLINYFRPDTNGSYYETQLFDAAATAVPLNGSNDDIAASVNDFAKRKIGVGFTDKSIVR